MRFTCTRDVHFDGELYTDGDIIEIADGRKAVAGQLLDIGAIVAAGGGKAGEKPLAKMNKAELLATAATEEVELHDGMTNQQMIDAIALKRSAAG